MVRYFFLDCREINVTGNELGKSPRILKFNPVDFWTSYDPVPTPSYATIDELLKKDKRFKEFKKTSYQSTIQLLIKEENIVDVKDRIYTLDYDDAGAGNMIRHVGQGSMKNSEFFSGLHHVPEEMPNNILNFKVLQPPNKQGVYVASFEIEYKNKILRKKEESTMFPREWSRQKLYDECEYALRHRTKIEGKDRPTYTSYTISGIPVMIFYNEDESSPTTLYPIWVAE